MSDYDSGYMDGKAVMYERIAELEQELAIGVNVIRDYETENASLREQLKSYFLTRKEIDND